MSGEPDSAPDDTQQLVADLAAVGWYLELDARAHPTALKSGSGHLVAARIFITVFCLVWSGICVALFLSDAGPAFGLLFSGIGLFCWAALVSLFRKSEVAFDDHGLVVLSRIGPFWSSKVRLEKRQIVGWKVSSQMNSGKAHSFFLRADSIFGKSHMVASGVRGQELVDRLVALLKEWKSS
jgi:hypothetical protein